MGQTDLVSLVSPSLQTGEVTTKMAVYADIADAARHFATFATGTTAASSMRVITYTATST